MTAAGAIEHLVGMQAQNAISPYFALWTRLDGFEPSWLSRLIAERRAVRASLMRATIHLVTAADFHRLSPLIQPVLTRALNGTFGRRLAGVDVGAVVAAGKTLLRDRPLTGAQLGVLLQARWPGRDGRVLAYAVQYLAPLVQVPPRGVWGVGGQAAWMTAEDWLGRPARSSASIAALAMRYLRAFGPATVRDMQVWSGLSGLRGTFDRLRPRLRTFTDERGNELFDDPGAPRPHADTPAPPRFLPDYDNALLAHADRSRIMSDDRRRRIAIGKGTVLVDGFVGATWKIDRGRRRAVLVIEPLDRLQKKDRLAIAEEGARLLAFAAAETPDRDVRFTSG